MTHRGKRAHQRASRRAQKREGAALLIVLFIVMMATATSMFAIQSTQFEQRSAGALHQATRTKYVAEAATSAVLALCYQGGTAGCTDLKRDLENVSVNRREEYGLPSYALNTAPETLYSLTGADLPVVKSVTNFQRTGLEIDRELGSAVDTAFAPRFMTIIEKWPVPNPGETRERYRLIVSTYGEVEIDANHDGTPDDQRSAGNEQRWGHETISATRAYFDVR